MAHRCDGCRRSLYKVPMAPMLHDVAWRKLARNGDTLCLECMLKRATRRRVHLSMADLRPCPFNLNGWPLSYFNLFRNNEEYLDPRRRKQWRAEAWKARRWNMFPPRVWTEI